MGRKAVGLVRDDGKWAQSGAAPWTPQATPPHSVKVKLQRQTCITTLPLHTHVWQAIAFKSAKPWPTHNTHDRPSRQPEPPSPAPLPPTLLRFPFLHVSVTLSPGSQQHDSSFRRTRRRAAHWPRFCRGDAHTRRPRRLEVRVSQLERPAARDNGALTESQLFERAPRSLGPQEPDQDCFGTDPAAVDEQVLPADGLRACSWTVRLATATNSMAYLDIPIGLTLVPKNCAALPQNWKMAMPRAR